MSLVIDTMKYVMHSMPQGLDRMARVGVTLLSMTLMVCAPDIHASSGGTGGDTVDTGYVTARTLVRGENGAPIFAEYDETGELVNTIGEAVEELAEAQVMSAERYRALIEKLEVFKEQNKNTSARGAYLLSTDDYAGVSFSTESGEEIPKPSLRRDTKSVLVRGEEALRSKQVNPVLLESIINLKDSVELSENIKSVLIDKSGRVIYQSESNIGYRTAFFKHTEDGFDFINDASRDRSMRMDDSATPVGPVPGARVSATIDWDSSTGADDTGRYRLHYYIPLCPGFQFDYAYDLMAEIPYQSFNQKGAYHHVYTATRQHWYFCSNLSLLPGLPAYVSQNLAAIEAEYPTILPRADFRIDVIMLTGIGSLVNVLDDGTVERVKLGEETKYKKPGFVSEISEEDLAKTDLYLFRESNGQLVTTREGLKLEEYTGYHSGGTIEGEGKFYYKFLVRGPATVDFTRRQYSFQELQARTNVDPDLHAHKSDHLRVGEQVRLVVINRPTGYIASVVTELQSAGNGEGIGSVSFPIDELLLRPPNLKIRAIRNSTVKDGATKDEERENLIGSEGSALTTDDSIVIQTEWYDHDGSALPSELEGYTGRLARIVAPNVLAPAGNDVANFDIKPGTNLEVVRLPNGGGAEHLYVQIAGEPSNRNPDFSSGGGGEDSFLEHRPKHFVPVKVPEYDVNGTVIGEGAAAKELAAQFAEDLTEYEDKIQQYLLDLQAYNEAILNGDPTPPVPPEPPEIPDSPVLDHPEVAYRWVTRPEMHFSVLDLKINEITIETKLDGTYAQVDYDLSQKGGQQPIPALERATGVEDETGKLQRELMFILGGYGALASLADGGNEETIALLRNIGSQLDLVPANQVELLSDILDKLQPDDFLSLQLVQSDDAANGLYEYSGLPLVIVSRFTSFPNYNLLPDPLRLGDYEGNPDFSKLLDRRLKAPPISLTRTTHLSCFNDEVCNAADRDITDSFQLFPIHVTQKIDLQIDVIDAQTQITMGTVIKQKNLSPGTWNFILTYDDIARHNIGHELSEDFLLKVIATPTDSDSTQLRQEIIHPGDLVEQFDNAILGNILQHEVLIQRGQLSLRREDMSLKGRGPQLDFIRSYTNQAQRNPSGLMSSGWSNNHNIYLQIDGYGDEPVDYNIPKWVNDVRGQLFRPSQIKDFERPYLISVSNGGQFKRRGNEWRPMRGYHGSLIEQGNGYQFTSKDGTKYFFDKPKRRWESDFTQAVQSGAIPNLIPTRVSYGDSLYNRLFITGATASFTLLDPLTRVNDKPILLDPNVRFGPSEPAPLRAIEDRNGNRMTYNYDVEYGGERLSSVSDAVGRSLNFYYTTFEIEQDSIYNDPDNEDPDVVDGKRVRGSLDYEGDRIAIQDPPEQDPSLIKLPPIERVRLTKVTGPDGIALNFNYAREGDDYLFSKFSRDVFQESYQYKEEQINPKSFNLSQVTDANGHSIKYSYKAPGVINSGILQYVKALNQEDLIDQVQYPDGNSASFDYNHSQNHRTYTDLRGYQTIYELNNFGQPTAIREPLGKTTRMTWSIDDGAADSVMTSRTDAEGHRTEYEYDAKGNISKETDPYGKKTISSWNQDFGILESRTDRNGNSISFAVNATNGNIEQEINAEGYITKHTYNEYGERKQTTDPRGNITTFSYDGYGNLETASEPEGSVTRYVNDIRGRRTRMTDPNGNVYTYNYDTLDRLLDTTDPDGYSITYKYDAKGNKLTEVDKIGLKLSYDYDERDRVKTVSRSGGLGAIGSKSYSYDGNSNLLSESDWYGRKDRHVYDELNRRIKSYSRLNYLTERSYDLVNNLKSVTDAEGRVTSYDYDDLNRVETITDADSNTKIFIYDNIKNVLSETNSRGYTTSYKYDKRYLKTKIINALLDEKLVGYDEIGNKTSETDEEGRVTTFIYDKQNRLIEKVDAYSNSTIIGYDYNGNVTSVTDRRNNKIQKKYDALNRPIQATDPENYVTKTEYDANGNRIKQIDARNGEYIYTYDKLNRLVSEKNPINAFVGYAYDNNGNKIRTKDARQTDTTYFYDFQDRLVLEVQAKDRDEQRTREFGYDKVDNLLWEEDFKGERTTHEYDNLNRKKKTIDRANYATLYEYDEEGNRTKVTDRRNHVAETRYDELNRPIKIIDPLLQEVSMGYDKVGNLVSEVDKRGTETTHEYDDLNRLTASRKRALTGNALIMLLLNEYDQEGNIIATTDANGNREQYEYDGRNLKTKTIRADNNEVIMAYDGNGNNTSITDELGQTTTSVYDAANRLESVTNYAGEKTSYAYDLNNNRTQVIRPKGNTARFAYDRLSRVQQITDAMGGITAYVYDNNDNLTLQTDANNNQVKYSYDKMDRRKTHTQVKSGGDLVKSYEYDPEGNKIAMVDPKGQRFEYDYDEINRLKQTRFPDSVSQFFQPIRTDLDYDPNNNVITIVETKLNNSATQFSDTTSMEYDLFDRMIESTQRGYTITISYDDNGNKTGVSSSGGNTVYTFDNRNRLKTATQNSAVTTYSYRADNMQEQVVYPNGTETGYTYDAANRTKTVINQISGGALISSYSYDYDTNGNRIEQVEQQPALAAPNRTTTYSYDDNDRMTGYIETDTGTGDSIEYAYQFDAVYNRTHENITKTIGGSVNTTSRTLTYDQTNWLTKIEDDNDSSKNIVYLYDANGNTLQKTDNTDVSQEITNFHYDSRDQMVQLTRGPPGSEQNKGNYDYDYRGIRVRHIGSERGDVDYYHDDTAIIDEYTGGTPLAHYNYADRLLSLNSQGGEQYYHYSALKTTANLTDAAGTIKVSYHTDPWGEITEQQGTSVNRQVFTGQEHDEQTGLIYFGARYYDPDIGRFITQDSYLGEPGTPPSLHRYLYAYGNPGVYYDPDGHAVRIDDEMRDIISNRYNEGDDYSSIFSDDRLVRLAEAYGITPQITPGKNFNSYSISNDQLGTLLARISELGYGEGHFTAMIPESGDKAETVRRQLSDSIGRYKELDEAHAYYTSELLSGRPVDVTTARDYSIARAYQESSQGVVGQGLVRQVEAAQKRLADYKKYYEIHQERKNVDSYLYNIDVLEEDINQVEGWLASYQLFGIANNSNAPADVTERGVKGVAVITTATVASLVGPAKGLSLRLKGLLGKIPYRLEARPGVVSTFGVGSFRVVPKKLVKPRVTDTGFGGFRATWGNDPKAFAMFERNGSGVYVSDLFRGRNPKGSGGQMLVDALQGAGIRRPGRIRFTNILEEQPTILQLQQGIAVNETVLGKTLQNAADSLGAKVISWQQGVYKGKVWIEATLSY